MTLKLRNDVVLEKIAGSYLLVALRSAWGVCPFAIQISPFAACIWKGILDGLSEDEIIDFLCREKSMDQERARHVFTHFIKAAKDYHYLLPEDET